MKFLFLFHSNIWVLSNIIFINNLAISIDAFLINRNRVFPGTSIVERESFRFKLESQKKNGKKKGPSGPVVPEFSRVVNVDQIPPRRPVLCRIIAKEEERAGLAERLDIDELPYFAANVTLSRRDQNTVLAEGTIEAHFKAGKTMEAEIVQCEFDTVLLDTKNGDLKFEEEMDYDDEIRSDGIIDIGEIATNYLTLELY